MRPEEMASARPGLAEASAAPAAEPDGRDLLVREQAAAIAHYKKMYDRSSALARIGVWESTSRTKHADLDRRRLRLFELPRGSEPIGGRDRRPLRGGFPPRHGKDARAGDRVRRQFHARHPDPDRRGNKRWLRLTADVERENGRSVRIFGTKQDIPTRKRRRRRFARSRPS